VVVVPVISLLAFRTGFSRKVGVGVGLAFAGLFLLTRPDDLVNLNRGDVLTFCGAVAFAFQIIYLERYTRRVPTDSLAVLQLLWTMLLSLPAGLLVDGPRFSYGWSFYAAVIYLAVFCSALAFLAQARAQKHVSATRAALIFSLEPVFAAIASFLFYGERLSAVEWLGGAMTVAGVILGEVPVLRSKTEQVRHNDV
jgi:drug/metabolite transporter (DMT)-like permease